MKALGIIIHREIKGYFETPLALVFMVSFLVFQGLFTFYLGQFFQRGQASLEAFFIWLPWLLLFFVPAIGMRMWPEEQHEGTIELLWSMPVSMVTVLLGKYLSALLFLILAIALTFPFPLIVNYLGAADNQAIIIGYCGSILLASGFLAITSAMSALTRSQVIAFIMSLTVCFLFTVSSFPLVLDFFSIWLPQSLLDVIAYFSFITHMDEMARGLIGIQHIVYFLSLVILGLYLTYLFLNMKRD